MSWVHSRAIEVHEPHIRFCFLLSKIVVDSHISNLEAAASFFSRAVVFIQSNVRSKWMFVGVMNTVYNVA